MAAQAASVKLTDGCPLRTRGAGSVLYTFVRFGDG
jgi:hypothetical protein